MPLRIELKVVGNFMWVLETDTFTGSSTIQDLKKMIESRYGPSPADQKLIFDGRELDDTELLHATRLGTPGHHEVFLFIPADFRGPDPSLTQVGGAVADDTAAAAAAAVAAANRRSRTILTPISATGEKPIVLQFSDTTGYRTNLEVLPSTTLDKLRFMLAKHKDWSIPARQMTFIYCSKPMTDLSRTISSFSELEQYTTIHVTRNMDKAALKNVIAPGDMFANCIYCFEPGVEFVMRPLCPTCTARNELAEVVVWENNNEPKVGSSKWEDILGAKVTCWKCRDEGRPHKHLKAGLGFMCRGKREGGLPCKSRNEKRVLQHCYAGTGKESDLLAALNGHFGFAVGGGFETKMSAADVAAYEEQRAKILAAQGTAPTAPTAAQIAAAAAGAGAAAGATGGAGGGAGAV